MRRFVAVWSIGLAVILVTTIALDVYGIHRPRTGDLPERVDAIVVFGGEDIRTRHALELIDRGASDTLVVSFGEIDRFASELCGQSEPFAVVCVEPSLRNTRGDARVFGALAQEHGWGSMIAVTGDYHVQRARLRLRRCFDGELAFTVIDWGRPRGEIVRHELLGTIQARWLQTTC